MVLKERTSLKDILDNGNKLYECYDMADHESF